MVGRFGEILRAPVKRARFIVLAFSLVTSSVLQLGPSTQSAQAALYTTNLAFQLDPNNSSSYSGSGDTWSDLSGLGRNFTRPATGVARPSFQSGSPSSFLFTRTTNSGAPPSHGGYFTGQNSWVGGNDFTVSAWIKTTGVGAGANHWELMHIISAESGGGAVDWGFGINNAGKLAFGTGASDVTYESPATVNDGAWKYVAATRTKATGAVKLYVNGALVYTSPSNSNTSTLNSNASMRIGAGDDGGVSFGGNIGAVYGYSALLNDTQISDNFDATKGAYGFTTSTTTTLTAASPSIAFGSANTLTATVNNSSATGTINFRNNGTSISGCSTQTVSAGVATCAFTAPSVGTFSNLTAVYSGDSTFSTSTSSALSVTVTQATPQINLTVAPVVTFRSTASIVATLVSAGSDGRVTFFANNKKIGGCINLQSTSLTVTCNWKASVHGVISLSAQVTPTSSNFGVGSALPKLVSASARTGRR